MTHDLTQPATVGVRDPFDGADWAATAFGGGRVRRRRRLSVRRLRRRQRAGLVFVVLGGAIVFVFGWLLVTGLIARHELAQVRREVHALRTQLTAGDMTAARHTAHQIGDHAAHAHALTT